MYWFTADEHYGHKKIIEYCNRPFPDVETMNETIIARHNLVVGKNDIVIHAGDFSWARNQDGANKFLRRLKGSHVLIKGSHDGWMPKSFKYMWRRVINGQFVVVCHYAMRTWERAHHGGWQLYGHSHGTLPPIGKQWDVGVDNNNFMPVSFDRIKEIMENLPIVHGAKHDLPEAQGS